MKAYTAELEEVQRQLEDLLLERDGVQSKIAGLRAEIYRIKRRGAQIGWAKDVASERAEPPAFLTTQRGRA